MFGVCFVFVENICMIRCVCVSLLLFGSWLSGRCLHCVVCFLLFGLCFGASFVVGCQRLICYCFPLYTSFCYFEVFVNKCVFVVECCCVGCCRQVQVVGGMLLCVVDMLSSLL